MGAKLWNAHYRKADIRDAGCPPPYLETILIKRLLDLDFIAEFFNSACQALSDSLSVEACDIERSQIVVRHPIAATGNRRQ